MTNICISIRIYYKLEISNSLVLGVGHLYWWEERIWVQTQISAWLSSLFTCRCLLHWMLGFHHGFTTMGNWLLGQHWLKACLSPIWKKCKSCHDCLRHLWSQKQTWVKTEWMTSFPCQDDVIPSVFSHVSFCDHRWRKQSWHDLHFFQIGERQALNDILLSPTPPS